MTTGDQPASAAIRTPDQRLRVFVSSTLAELAEERAAVARAVNALRLTPYGYARLSSLAWSSLASLAVDEGRVDEARTLLQDAVDVDAGAELGAQVLTSCLVAFAQLEMAEGNPRRAAVALGAASGLRSRAGLRVWPSARRSENEVLAHVRQALPPDQFEPSFAEGGAFTRRDALAFIMAG